MVPEVLVRLLFKFSSKSFEDSGLGLFISKIIIEAHGSSVWAENSSIGKAATFAFSLPSI
ncbi:MAG: ATP-binding protein [Nitrososphaeraceae archaeon]